MFACPFTKEEWHCLPGSLVKPWDSSSACKPNSKSSEGSSPHAERFGGISTEHVVPQCSPCVFPLLLHRRTPWQKKDGEHRHRNKLVGRAHRELHSTQVMEPLWHGNSWRLGQRNGELHPVTRPGVWPRSENGSAGLDSSQHYKLSLCLHHKGEMAQKRLATAGKVTFTSLCCPADGSAQGSRLWPLTLRALRHFCLSCSSFLSCPFDWDPPASAGPATRSASGDWHTRSKLGTAVTVLSCLFWGSFYLQVLCLVMLQIRIIKSHPSVYTSSGFPSTVCLLSLYVHKKNQLTVAIKAGMETLTLLLH